MKLALPFSPSNIYAHFFGADVAVAPEYLAVTLIIAFVIYKFSARNRRPEMVFWAWVLPKQIYNYSACKLDIKLFFLGRIMGLFGLFNKVVFTTLFAGFVASMFQENLALEVLGILENPLLIASMLLVVNDFVMYWIHRIYHQNALIWPIHSVHHSAEVLTPITTYRQHPLALIIAVCVHSLVLGLLQGLFLGVSGAEFEYSQLAGINVFYFGFLLLVHNFHHSHIWVSFGAFWGRVLISPAQHQIHHSLELKHHNKNYGEIFALWDWMFGTLYVPKTYEDISVGLADATGKKITQKHSGIIQALIVPLCEMGSVMRFWIAKDDKAGR